MKFLLRPLQLFVFAFLYISASASQAQQGADNQPPLREARVADDAFLKTPTPAWVLPAEIPETNEKAPVVFRLADTQFLVEAGATVFVRRAVLVNDNAALGEIGQLTIPFVPDYQKAQLHKLRILRGGQSLDRRETVNIRFLQRETRLESGIYSGVVIASLLINDVRVGDTLEYEYSVSGSNPVFQGKFFDAASWQLNIPVARRRVVLNHPAAREIRHRFVGNDPPRIEAVRESAGNNTRQIWTQDNLAAVRIAGYYPRGYAPVANLQFSEYRNWNEVARWAQTLFSAEVRIDDELASVIARIKALPGTDERASAALQFVQNKIRYFSVSLGESSHRPSAPQVVMKQRFGDCKDKSWLLIAMLRELGIAAQPVLVPLDGGAPAGDVLPTPGLFDHVIVGIDIDGKSYFVDPTRIGQAGALAQMGQIHENAEMLVAAENTSGLTTLRSENVAELNNSEVAERIAITAFSKPGTLTIRHTERGVNAEVLRMVAKTRPDDLAHGLNDDIVKRYPGAKASGQPAYDDNPAQNQFTITTRYDIANLEIEERDAWILRFLPANLVRIVGVPPSVQRNAPLGIAAFPFQGQYTLDVQFPPEVSAMLDPRSNRVRNKAFEFSMSERFRGNNAAYDMRLQTTANRVNPDDLSGFAADVRKMLQTMGGVIVVPKRLLTKPSASAAKTDSLGQRLTQRTEERIKRYTATIDSGKLRGKDLAAAYADRSSSYSDLDKTAESLKDAEQAIALDDGNPGHYRERAIQHFKLGDLQKSVADFTRALTLGADPAATYYRRGMTHFYLGKLDDALSDFEQSLTDSDTEARLFSMLWYAWTARQLDKPLPEKLQAEINTNAQGAWPRPALALFTGKLSPADVLKIAESKTGDERVMTLCEAYFYIGQYYLTQKDAATAKTYFEKARDTQVIVYIEHDAAKRELARLAKP